MANLCLQSSATQKKVSKHTSKEEQEEGEEMQPDAGTQPSRHPGAPQM